MTKYISLFMLAMLAGLTIPLPAQDSGGSFIPVVFWGDNSDKGVILSAPNEMGVIDEKGLKYGKILASEPVLSAYLSPDGKMLAFTTVSGLWLVKIQTGEKSLIASGMCDYLRWNKDGLGFVFAIFKKIDNSFNAKFFWADSDGKNVKQVYP